MSDSTIKEKQVEAKNLLQEVKRLNAEGINDENTATKAHQMLAQSQKLMEEVKELELNKRKQILAEEAEKLEKSFVEKEFQAGVKHNGPAVLSPSREQEDPNEHFSPQVKLAYSQKAADILRLKALNSATGAAGGFLVPPSYMQELFAETRRQANALRRNGLLAEHPVSTNQILLPTGAGAASVGIVAESATKPTADQTYGQVTVNIYTWAGISKVTNQLLQDSSPTAADLVNRELGGLLGNLEEQKIYSGTGTAEPRGIINTAGINNLAYTDATPTGQELIDRIIDAIAEIQQNYFAPPNAIVMHPRRLAFLQKSKDSQLNYIFNDAGSFRAPGGLGVPTGATRFGGDVANRPSLVGLPIIASTNVPTNRGVGVNEDVIFVADWNEAHWFQRTEATMDTSEAPGFATNETWFRLEERAGFSAERYPKAFAMIGGTGLVP